MSKVTILLKFKFIYHILVQSVMTPEQLVIKHLLTNHSKDGRPIQDPRQSVNVTIQLYIAELLTLVWFETFLGLETRTNNTDKKKIIDLFKCLKVKTFGVSFLVVFRMKSRRLYQCMPGLISQVLFFIYMLDTVNSKCALVIYNRSKLFQNFELQCY